MDYVKLLCNKYYDLAAGTVTVFLLFASFLFEVIDILLLALCHIPKIMDICRHWTVPHYLQYKRKSSTWIQISVEFLLQQSWTERWECRSANLPVGAAPHRSSSPAVSTPHFGTVQVPVWYECCQGRLLSRFPSVFIRWVASGWKACEKGNSNAVWVYS